MNLEQIKSAEWSLSTAGPGAVVEGIDDINQCIGIICTTVPGSDPLRPQFGCGLFDFVDTPSATAAPLMAAAIAKALRIWEPRIKVDTITYTIKDGTNVVFSIAWTWRAGFQHGEADLVIGLTPTIAGNGVDQTAPYLTKVLTTEDLKAFTAEDGTTGFTP